MQLSLVKTPLLLQDFVLLLIHPFRSALDQELVVLVLVIS